MWYATGTLNKCRVALLIPALLLGAQLMFAGGGGSQTVDARCNIYSAGHLYLPSPGGGGGGTFCGGGGVSPTGSTYFTFYAVTGGVSPAEGYPLHDAEGVADGPTDINGSGGISGIYVPNRQLFLAGVFLDDNEPADPQPPRIDYSGGVDQIDYYPQLRQVFFIGDGLTSRGVPQRFHPPVGATWLYLGFADGWAYQGDPGWYDDNSGQLIAQYTVGEAARISSMTLRSSSVKGGRPVKGSVELQSPAPAGGVSIPILSSDSSAVLSGACSIRPGSKRGNFALSSRRVGRSRRVNLTAYATNTVRKRVTITR